MFCIVSWPDTSSVLKCCIASLQEQNVSSSVCDDRCKGLETASPSCSLLLRLLSSEKWLRFQRLFFFFLLILLFLTWQPPEEKRTLTRRGSSGWPLRSLPVIGCYQRSPLSKTEASVAAVRIPFHTASNQTDLEVGAAALNAEEAGTGIDTAEPETLDNRAAP